MSWRDPNWKYEPAATHGDPALFAQRQRERALAYGQMLQQKTPSDPLYRYVAESIGIIRKWGTQ